MIVNVYQHDAVSKSLVVREIALDNRNSKEFFLLDTLSLNVVSSVSRISDCERFSIRGKHSVLLIRIRKITAECHGRGPQLENGLIGWDLLNVRS